MTLNRDARSLENWMHARVAKAFRVTMLSDFEASVLSKGYVTREDYEEAYRLYVEKMTAAGFIVEKIVDDSGYYVRNYSSERRNELFSGGTPCLRFLTSMRKKGLSARAAKSAHSSSFPRSSTSNPNRAINLTISSILGFAFPWMIKTQAPEFTLLAWPNLELNLPSPTG